MPEASMRRPEQKMKTEMTLKAFNTAGYLAIADVEVNGLFTIRNVKIREGDYGLDVVMPRIKEWNLGRYKDACYFKTRELRDEFSRSVVQAYEQYMGQDEEFEYEEYYEDETDLEEEDEEEEPVPSDSDLSEEGMESEGLTAGESAEEENLLIGSQEM